MVESVRILVARLGKNLSSHLTLVLHNDWENIWSHMLHLLIVNGDVALEIASLGKPLQTYLTLECFLPSVIMLMCLNTFSCNKYLATVLTPVSPLLIVSLHMLL